MQRKLQTSRRPTGAQNDAEPSGNRQNDSAKQPTYSFITLDRAATLEQRKLLYGYAREIATDGIQMKSEGGVIKVLFRKEEQMRQVEAKLLGEWSGTNRVFSSTGAGQTARPKSQFKRWIVAG